MTVFNRRNFLSLSAGVCALGTTPAMADGPIRMPGGVSVNPYDTISAINTPTKNLALTFDDGPHPRLTPILLDTLRRANVKATFYLIGRRVAAHPQLTARIAEEGHEIGNHSWSHPFLNRYSDAGVLDEIDRTSNAIFDATGKAPVTFRPPYGAFTERQRRMLHDARGLPSVLWSVDPRDWRRPGSSVVAERILSHAAPGAIVLSHDIHAGTVDAMPSVIRGLRARDIGMTTLSTLLGWPNWSDLKFSRG